MKRPLQPRCRYISAIVLMFVVGLALSGCSSGSGGTTTQYLSGQVVYTDKLAGSTVSVCNASGMPLVVTGSEGLYHIVTAGLPSSFTICVTGGQTPDGKAFTGYLKRTVKFFDPNAYYDVNGLTTLVAVYLERHPKTGYDNAVTAVRTYLDLPDNETFEEVSGAIAQSAAWFSDASFWNKLIGSDYNVFIESVMQDIEAGRVISFADASRTADLPTLFSSDEWEFAATASSVKGKQKAADRRLAALGTVLNIVGGIFEGVSEIMDMQEQEANVETLNRIDENIKNIQSQLIDIKAQTGRIENLLTEKNWQDTNKELRGLEEGCIAPARDALSQVLKQKEQMVSMSAAARTAAQPELDGLTNKFNAAMEQKSCGIGSTISSFENLLNMYANKVTQQDEDKDNSAIQLYTNAVNTKSNDEKCEKCTYQSIENTFLRFLYYQATALQLYLHYELNKEPDRAKWPQKQKEIVDRFLQGPSLEYDNERMIKQVSRFVPAVETFVVSHNKEPYYKRWLACDVMNSLDSDPAAGGACKDFERPFLRSQVIADQLLGHIKNKSGAVVGAKYGLFMKAIQLKVAGINGLTDRKFVIKNGGTNYQLTPAETRDVAGKNPYILYGEKEEATWQIATYRIEDIVAPGTLTFELSHDANDTVMPVYFRNSIYLFKSMKTNDATKYAPAKYYNGFNLWTVPVRDVKTLYYAVNAGWGVWKYYPFSISDCNGDACTSVLVDLNNIDGVGSKLKLYRLGAEKDHVVIGYWTDGKRYILMPSNVWDWPKGGFSVFKYERIDAFAVKDILGTDNCSKIYWYMENDPNVAWGNAYYFSRTDANNVKKYMSSVGGDTPTQYMFYEDRLYNTFKPVFDGEWR